MSDYHIHELQAAEIEPWLHELGRLRIEVFREYPYLYDGDKDYEHEYLRRYLRAKGSLLVVVTDSHETLIGATTCLPMSEEGAEFRQPFEQADMDIGEIFYFGESVLLPEWRGRGIGHLFFDRRENHARKLGYKTAAFCAVDRRDDDSRRPQGYRPLDGFWRKRGYQKQEGLRAKFSWKELGSKEETEQTLTFWVKPLSS